MWYASLVCPHCGCDIIIRRGDGFTSLCIGCGKILYPDELLVEEDEEPEDE